MPYRYGMDASCFSSYSRTGFPWMACNAHACIAIHATCNGLGFVCSRAVWIRGGGACVGPDCASEKSPHTYYPGRCDARSECGNRQCGDLPLAEWNETKMVPQKNSKISFACKKKHSSTQRPLAVVFCMILSTARLCLQLQPLRRQSRWLHHHRTHALVFPTDSPASSHFLQAATMVYVVDGKAFPGHKPQTGDTFKREPTKFFHEGPLDLENTDLHLYVCAACPWAMRVLMTRNLSATLRQKVTVSVVSPYRNDDIGWEFLNEENEAKVRSSSFSHFHCWREKLIVDRAQCHCLFSFLFFVSLLFVAVVVVFALTHIHINVCRLFCCCCSLLC